MTDKMKKNQILTLIALLFLSTVVLSVMFFSIAAEKRENKKRDAVMYGQNLANAIRLTLDTSVKSTEALKLFYSTYGEDFFVDFDSIAFQVAEENPAVSSLYVAPKGIVKVAYPEEVYSSTIGFNMLESVEQGPRARLAVDSRKVTVAGPHFLVEGGKGLIVRNPLFDEDEFVGFTIAVLNWDKFVDQILANTQSTSQKYKFAVWKQDIDETAVCDEEGYILRNTDQPVSKEVDIEIAVPNDTWHLVVEPVDGWSVFSEMKWQILISVFLSLLIIAGAMQMFISKQRKLVIDEKIREAENNKAHMEELSKALAAAEEANNAKTTFLNNMSHDIRTPMNAILGFTHIMENELDQPDKIKDHLGKVKLSGEYLLTLINNVLEVARIDSGKEVVDEEFVDLTSDKCSVAPLLENEIKNKNLNYTQAMDIQNRFVLADVQKIKEITMNLMSNAIKYTPEGGNIHLQFNEIPCEREGYATYVCAISDTGVGMSKKFQEQIFDSFSRERNTTESKVVGTGLGMSIVKKLTDLMGGTVEVESELGKGTTIRVTLSLRVVDNPQDYWNKVNEVTSNKKINVEGKRVLVAEDNDLNAEIAIAILEEAGVAAERACDGVECVNMINEKDAGYYDMILMDIQMPNLNGYDAARKIRSLKETEKAKIPIVAMTANAFEEDKKNAIDAGMDGHLAKPIEISKFIEMLEKVLK